MALHKSPHRTGSALQTIRISRRLGRVRLLCAGEFVRSQLAKNITSGGPGTRKSGAESLPTQLAGESANGNFKSEPNFEAHSNEYPIDKK